MLFIYKYSNSNLKYILVPKVYMLVKITAPVTAPLFLSAVNHIPDEMRIKNPEQYCQAFNMNIGYTKCDVVVHVNEIQRAS